MTTDNRKSEIGNRTAALKTVAVIAAWLILCAHAVVLPGTSRPGGHERYVLRVPNESDNATVRVELTFPSEVRVISFADVPGWKLTTTTDSTGAAKTAVWTGTLPPERFVEFPFMGVNPKSATTLTWPVVQVYANGDRREWTGPVGSKNPASVTVIADPTPPSTPISWPTMTLAGLALVAAALSLARRRAPAS